MLDKANILPFTDPLQGFAAGIQLAQVVPILNNLVELVQAQSQQIRSLLENQSRVTSKIENADCWLDATKAAKYMDLSKSTFDKYRYGTNVKITGYPLDGKILYKKSDLDNFVKLYDLKSSGIA